MKKAKKIQEHNLRIVELITKGFRDQEIAKIIYTEFNIWITIEEIQKKRSNSYVSKVGKQTDEIENQKLSLIKKALIHNDNQPKTSREIKDLIFQESGIKFTRIEIRDILWSRLIKQINYCKTSFSYCLKDPEPNIIEEDKSSTNEDKLFLVFKEINALDIIFQFRESIKKSYIQVDSGDRKIDNIITAIVKDNKITTNEERFLKQKGPEYGISENILEQAKKSLNANNPYLDNLMHIIYEDGIITNEEIVFLKEKCIENRFSTEFVNARFWQIGITFYLYSLRNEVGFDKIIVLWALIYHLTDEKTSEHWLFESLNIFSSNDIGKSIEAAINKIEIDIYKKISESEILNISAKDLFKSCYKAIKLNSKGEESKLELLNSAGLTYFIKLLEEEKLRIGTPDVNLLVENVKFRIEHKI